jgi:tetratricopeptide (TPR) repeat protein
MAKLALQMGLRRTALRLCRVGTQVNPNDIAARRQYAATLWLFDESELALAQCRLLATADPTNMAVLYHLAYVLRSLERYGEAIDVLERALAIETLAEFHVELARCYQALGRLDEAEAALNRALRHSPDHVDAMIEKVRLAGVTRRWPDAVDIGVALMSRQPSAEIAYHVGVGLSQSGRSEEAEAVLRTGLALEPGNIDLTAELAVVLSDQGRHGAARALIDEALVRQGADYNLNVAASHVFLNQGDRKQALEEAREAVRLNSEVPESHFALASACLELEDGDEALAAFAAVLALVPRLPDAKAGRAASLCLLGRYEESLRAFGEVLEIDPDYFARPTASRLRSLYARAQEAASGHVDSAAPSSPARITGGQG